MKKSIVIILMFLLIIAMPSFADSYIHIVVDGNEVSNKSLGEAFVLDNRTFVPIKMVSLALGKSEDAVKWDNDTRTVTVDGQIKFQIGSNLMSTPHGEVTRQVSPIIKGGRTYIPFKYLISDALGLEYDFKQESGYNWLLIYKNGRPVDPVVIPTNPDVPSGSLEDLYKQWNSSEGKVNGSALSNSSISNLTQSKNFLDSMNTLGYSYGHGLSYFGGTVTVDPYGSVGSQSAMLVGKSGDEWVVTVQKWDSKIEKAFEGTVSAIAGKEFGNWITYADDYNDKNYPEGKWYTKYGVKFMDEKNNAVIHIKK